jgi:uncharacterized MnhB-related membrane protein
MILFISLLVLLMLVGAAAAFVLRDLLSAIIAATLVSLIAAILFYFMQAPDVAMAEAAIGAALTTAIFIVAVRRTNRYEQ